MIWMVGLHDFPAYMTPWIQVQKIFLSNSGFNCIYVNFLVTMSACKLTASQSGHDWPVGIYYLLLWSLLQVLMVPLKSPRDCIFLMESDRGLAPITIFVSDLFPYVVTLGAARTEMMLTALNGFMNEDSEKDLWYHFCSAISQNSIVLYKGGRRKVRGKMQVTDQVYTLPQYLGLFKDEVFFQAPLAKE